MKFDSVLSLLFVVELGIYFFSCNCRKRGFFKCCSWMWARRGGAEYIRRSYGFIQFFGRLVSNREIDGVHKTNK